MVFALEKGEGVVVLAPGGGGREKDGVRFWGGGWLREREEEGNVDMDVGCCCCWEDHELVVVVGGGAVAAPRLMEEGWAASGEVGRVGLVVGWRGCENWVAVGVMGWKFARSGVTVLKPGWALTALNWVVGTAAGAAGGLDHEKAAVGVGFLLLLPAVGETTAALEAMLSQPESSGFAEAPPDSPLTSSSKSVSVVPFASRDEPVTGPKDMKSSLRAEALALPPASSCSFLVCSSSTLLDSVLMRSMNPWNCLRSRSGPKLMLQRTGRMSMATKSASATLPTTCRTFSAAIMTAGSFVLIALISGTIFSCMVYLSSAVDEVAFFFCGASPSRPSSPLGSLEPPQSVTKAWRPLTLMARLFVLLKITAMTGNSSFLMVLKSN